MITISEVVENQTNSSLNNMSLIISISISLVTLIVSFLFSFLTYHFNKKSHYSSIISEYRNEWLKRVKANTIQFISIAMTKINGEKKYKELLTYKLKIFSDLNIIENSNKKDEKSNVLDLKLQKQMDTILKCSKDENNDESVKEYYAKAIEELIRLLNIFYTIEWETTKKNAMPGYIFIKKSDKKVSALLKKYDLNDKNDT